MEDCFTGVCLANTSCVNLCDITPPEGGCNDTSDCPGDIHTMFETVSLSNTHSLSCSIYRALACTKNVNIVCEVMTDKHLFMFLCMWCADPFVCCINGTTGDGTCELSCTDNQFQTCITNPSSCEGIRRGICGPASNNGVCNEACNGETKMY